MSLVETILVVDDEPDALVLLQHAFDKVGMMQQLQTVGDGDEAIAYLAGSGSYGDRTAHPLPQLVLLDLKLPRRTGFDVLEWIRGRDELHALPVIVLSSSRDRDDIARAYRAGANSYLVKPTSLRQLTERVRSLCEYWFSHNEVPPVSIAAG